MLCHLGASLYDLHENEEAVRVYSKALELAEYTALRGTLLYNRAISYGSVGLKKAGGGLVVGGVAEFGLGRPLGFLYGFEVVVVAFD